jgi:hypothetical protein
MRSKSPGGLAVIEWKDNFGFPHFDISAGNTARCSTSLQDLFVNADGSAEKTDPSVLSKPVTALVYPNPSSKYFRVYLSLATGQRTELSLFSIDGKKIYQNTVQPYGIVEIDATAYRPGVYILKVRQGQYEIALKVIKE